MVTARRDVGSIPHIFSHINMTYHVLHLVLKSSSCPPLPSMGIWLDDAGVESANIGTGVKKVWAEVYGAWGRFEPADKPMKPSKKAKKEVVPEGKVVKNIMMPAMPARAKKVEVS